MTVKEARRNLNAKLEQLGLALDSRDAELALQLDREVTAARIALGRALDNAGVDL